MLSFDKFSSDIKPSHGQPKPDYISGLVSSSIHVLYFLRHAAYFWSTWITPCVHLKKYEGLLFWTDILVGGWRLSERERRVMKERNVH